MSLATVEFYSAGINQIVTYSLFLPDVGEGPFPVLFQLHGLTDNHAHWINHSNITRYAEQYPMAVVFPDGGTSFYVNWKGDDRIGRRKYEDLIIKDIPAHLKRNFNVTDGPWAIGGLSMGGGGSMRLGVKYPEMFASIWSHSSKFEFSDMQSADQLDDFDARHYAEKLTHRNEKPVISFDCGTEDVLIDENRAFHAYLEDIGLDHSYAEHPGDHDWDYWDTHVKSAIEQHARVLGVEKVLPPQE